MINQDHGRKNEQPKQQQSQQRWKARDNIEAATRQGYGRTHRQVGRVSSRDLCVCVRERMNVFVSKPARTRRAREERQSHPGNAWETSKNKQTKNRLSQGIHGVKNERENKQKQKIQEDSSDDASGDHETSRHVSPTLSLRCLSCVSFLLSFCSNRGSQFWSLSLQKSDASCLHYSLKTMDRIAQFTLDVPQ